MKIKRTLPSISLYSPINRHSLSISQKLQQQKFLYNPITITMTKHQASSQKKYNNDPLNLQNRNNESFFRQQHSPERSTSSRKPIFENKSRTQSKSRSSSPIQTTKIEGEKKVNIKKNVTFGNVASNFQTNRQSQNMSINRKKFDESDLNNSYKASSPPTRNYKRKSIFQKSKKSLSPILKQSHPNQPLPSPSQPIPVILNIKSLSDHIKNNSGPKQVVGSNSNSNFSSNSNMGTDQKILQKIQTLEHIVKDIQVKFDSSTLSNMKDIKQQDLSITNQTPFHSHQLQLGAQNRLTGLNCTLSQIQNNLLKLQLEQMRRCQRIAKENQILYGKLVRNIQRNQEQIRNSRRSIRNSRRIEQMQRQRQRQRSGSRSSKKFYRTNPNATNSVDYFNFKTHKQNYPNPNSNSNSKKITAFEDFSQTKQINKGNYLQNQNQGIQVQIASPFLVEENRRNLQYSYGNM